MVVSINGDVLLMDIKRGICPDGWHLPLLQEWQQLEMDLGMSEAAANATSGWQGTDQGTQIKEGGSSGFEAVLGGFRNTSGLFLTIDISTAFWTATQQSSFIAHARMVDNNHAGISHSGFDKKYGHAVRCVKD